MDQKHKTLMPMTAISIAEIDEHPFTHALIITSAGHTFAARFQFPEGKIWIEHVPHSIRHYRLKMSIGKWDHTTQFEDELGHFAQCVSESIHFYTKLRLGHFVFLLQTMMECMVYFGKVYGRITVDEHRTVRPAREN